MPQSTKRLRELRTRATQGEWCNNVWTTGRWVIEPYRKDHSSVHPIAEIHPQHNNEQEANAQLIVETINALPKLLEIIRLQGKALKHYRDKYEICGFADVAEQALQQIKKIEEGEI